MTRQTVVVAARGMLSVVAVLLLGGACSDSGKPNGTEIDSEGGSQSTKGNVDSECMGRDPGEACGEAGMGRYCIDKRCVFNTCGDGVKAGDEACDDGNEVAGDGCDADCQEECHGSASCAADSSTESSNEGYCGDGKLDDGEECDDGNTDESDACSNRCKKNVCGNKRVDASEECDDGNMKAGDGCSPSCLHERCRNGEMDPGEECDDGNQDEFDGCNNRCKIMICGDGKQQDREECDDGNSDDDDGCSSHCVKEFCGDNIKQKSEDCDGDLNCKDCKIMIDECSPCREKNCRKSYMDLGIDFVAGCLENKPDPQVVMRPVQPGEFSDPCTAVLTCVQTKHCARAELGDDAATPCWCGSATPNECTTMNGPADDAPCKDVFMKSAMATTWQDTTIRLSDLSFPAGYAWFVIGCEAKFCAKECDIVTASQ